MGRKKYAPEEIIKLLRRVEIEILIGERSVETVRSDGVFGEMALIDDQPRAASARAKSHCELVPVTKKHFLLLLRARPDFAIQVMRVMSQRIRSIRSPK
jgi:CRP-like cAMP-binding protein